MAVSDPVSALSFSISCCHSQWLQLHNNGIQATSRNRSTRSISNSSNSGNNGNNTGHRTPSPAAAAVHVVTPSASSPSSSSSSSEHIHTATESATESDKSLHQLPNRELVIRCSRPFSFGVLPYSVEQLSQASTTAELLKLERESTQACINIDPYLMGIGGDDTR